MSREKLHRGLGAVLAAAAVLGAPSLLVGAGCVRAGFDAAADRAPPAADATHDTHAADRATPAADATHDTHDATCHPAWRCSSWTLDPPTNVSELNSPGQETGPVLSADCLTVYFGSTRSGGLGQADIWTATRNSRTDPFGTPSNLSSVTVNGAATENALLFTTDGTQAFLQTDRVGGLGLTDFWMATRPDTKASFGPFAPLTELNSSLYEVNLVLSQDGLRAYFARLPPGAGGAIFLAKRAAMSQPFSTPTIITELDSPDQDDSPAISADETLIIFSSWRPGGLGGADMWYATRKTRNDPFAAPKLLPVVNSANQELNAFLACGDEELWFVSGPGGGWDIYRTRFVAGP